MRVDLIVNGKRQNLLVDQSIAPIVIGLAQLRALHEQAPTEELAKDIEAYEKILARKDRKDFVEIYLEKRQELILSGKSSKVVDVLNALEG